MPGHSEPWAVRRGSLPTLNCNNKMCRGIRLEWAKGPSHCWEVGWGKWDFSVDRWFGFAKAAEIWMRSHCGCWVTDLSWAAEELCSSVYRITFSCLAPSLCDPAVPEVLCPVGVGPPTRNSGSHRTNWWFCTWCLPDPVFSKSVTVDGSRCCRMCCTSDWLISFYFKGCVITNKQRCIFQNLLFPTLRWVNHGLVHFLNPSPHRVAVVFLMNSSTAYLSFV